MWISMLRYVVKHAVAGCLVVGAVGALVVVTYFGLMAWAMVTNAPPGGPLALPFWFLIFVAASIAAVAGVLWPVTAAGEALCRRALRWPTWTQIPVTTLLLFAEMLFLGLLYAAFWRQPLSQSLQYGLLTGLALLIPLGIYWWSLQLTDWLLGTASALVRRAWTWWKGNPCAERVG